jgi:hypothetical protein
MLVYGCWGGVLISDSCHLELDFILPLFEHLLSNSYVPGSIGAEATPVSKRTKLLASYREMCVNKGLSDSEMCNEENKVGV